MNQRTVHRSSRLAGIEVSEILARAVQAADFKRAGRPVIVLAAGEPDFDTPDHVKAAACQAIASGQTKYTAVDGSPELKMAIQHKLLTENRLSYHPNEITCGAGAKQVLFNALMATLEPGDEVILPAPYWTSYIDLVKIAGGTPVEVACSQESGFLLQPSQLEEAISPRTRWLILNSPSNPCVRRRQSRPLERRHDAAAGGVKPGQW